MRFLNHRKGWREKKNKHCTRCRRLLGLSFSFWNKRSLSCTGKTLQPLSHCFTPSSFRSSGGMKNGSSGQNNHAGIGQCLLFLLFVRCCQKKQNWDQNQTPAGRKTGESSALWKYFIKYFSIFILKHFKADWKPPSCSSSHSPTLAGLRSRARGRIDSGDSETVGWTRPCPGRFPDSHLLLQAPKCKRCQSILRIHQSASTKTTHQSSQQDMDSEGLGIRGRQWHLWEHYLPSTRPQSWGCFQTDRGAAGPRERHLVEEHGNYLIEALTAWRSFIPSLAKQIQLVQIKKHWAEI